MSTSSSLRRCSAAILAALSAGGLGGASSAQAAQGWWQDDGATWTQSYITEPDGTVLHADVLRPSDLPLNAKTPVILSIGPYYGHAGEVGPDGVLDNPVDYYPLGAGNDGNPQPDNRFRDFIEGADLFHHGYAWVQVDLRGFGGSTGCTDFGGAGEQADVKSAVQWAASQPWSTGRVGMYGKSYDAYTGIMGEAVAPRGLAGIIAQEPVYDGYWNVYAYGVNAFSAPFPTQAEDYHYSYTPNFVPGDQPQYIADSLMKRPSCLNNVTGQHNPDRFSPWWQQHDLVKRAAGHKVPIFLTQGFLENNTKPLATWDLFDELRAPKHAWFGMWDHIRGNDVAEGDNAATQPWVDQVMRFLNHYVKGLPLSDPSAATDRDPAVSVQTSDGSWRAEQQWPPLDSRAVAVPLNAGTYTDSASTADKEDGAGTSGATGVWTISPPLSHPAHFSGVPEASLDVTAQLPGSDLSVDVYDVRGNASMLVSRTAYLLSGTGEQQVNAELYGNDWQFAAGDRIAILVAGANGRWWSPQKHAAGTVTVNPGSVVTLPWLAYSRSAGDALSGMKYPQRLKTWLGGSGSLAMPAATVTAGLSPAFPLPGAETAAPGGFNAGAFGVPRRFVTDGVDASPGSIR